jgi:hypothetical protein
MSCRERCCFHQALGLHRITCRRPPGGSAASPRHQPAARRRARRVARMNIREEFSPNTNAGVGGREPCAARAKHRGCLWSAASTPQAGLTGPVDKTTAHHALLADWMGSPVVDGKVIPWRASAVSWQGCTHDHEHRWNFSRLFRMRRPGRPNHGPIKAVPRRQLLATTRGPAPMEQDRHRDTCNSGPCQRTLGLADAAGRWR